MIELHFSVNPSLAQKPVISDKRHCAMLLLDSALSIHLNRSPLLSSQGSNNKLLNIQKFIDKKICDILTHMFMGSKNITTVSYQRNEKGNITKFTIALPEVNRIAARALDAVAKEIKQQIEVFNYQDIQLFQLLLINGSEGNSLSFTDQFVQTTPAPGVR